MEITKAVSHKTELEDRILWYDGDSTVDEKYIMDVVSRGQSLDGLYIDVMTQGIIKYNNFVSADEEIHVKTNIGVPDFDFDIPEKYLTLDVEKYVAQRLSSELIHFVKYPEKRTKRIETTKLELQLYEKLGFFNILRTLIYIINTFQDKNIVWGVGRGSSVASYVLYLIGVHDVDSVEYDLNVTEFLRS